MDYEALLEKGIEYVERVRAETSKQKVNNPSFITLLACLSWCDDNDIDFHHLVDKLYRINKYRTVEKFRSDFMVYENFRDRDRHRDNRPREEEIIH